MTACILRLKKTYSLCALCESCISYLYMITWRMMDLVNNVHALAEDHLQGSYWRKISKGPTGYCSSLSHYFGFYVSQTFKICIYILVNEIR